MTLVMRYGRRIGLPQQALLDAAFAAVIGGIVGSRLLYVIIHARDFLEAPLGALKVWEGGMMYFGGLLFGMIVGVAVAVRRGLLLWPALDTVAPALGAGQALGRLACLIAGCCYGMEWDGAWSITFPHDELSSVPPALQGVPLLPAQVLQIGEGLFLWGLGLWAFRRRRWDGEAFVVVMGVAGVTRFLIEGLRDDDARGFFLEETFGHTFSTSRVLGLAMVVFAIAVWVLRTLRQSAPKAGVEVPLPAEPSVEKA
jgi:phosphatidylglycerol---prolipoprotein diacylglyceryl transferase